MLIGAPAKYIDQIELTKSLGFDFAEINLISAANQSEWWASELKSGSILSLVAHGPIGSPVPDFNYTRRRYLPAVTRAIDVASRMDIHLLTFHFEMTESKNKDFRYGKKVSQIKELMEYGKKNGVVACLENEKESAEDMRTLISEIPDLNVTLDIGHANLSETPDHILQMIEVCGKNIRHVHCHDNLGGLPGVDDRHLPLGEGNIDFPSVFRSLKLIGYDATITLEINRDRAKSLRAVRKIIEGGI
jgi:sugar phosphate isomerase/epimerase